MEVAEEATVKADKLSYKEKLNFASPIAQPMASKGLTKRLVKLVKAATEKKNVRIGLKDVQKQVRRGEKGIVVFGADVTPIEIICHMPAICEEQDIPYCYVPSREDLGHAAGMNRNAVMVLIIRGKDYEELFNECEQELKQLPIPM